MCRIITAKRNSGAVTAAANGHQIPGVPTPPFWWIKQLRFDALTCTPSYLPSTPQ